MGLSNRYLWRSTCMKRAVLTIGRRVEVKPSKSDRHGQMARGSQSWARLFVRNLPPTLRTAFQLRDFEGLPLQEIAGILGITIGATKTRVSRARATLRDLRRKLESGRIPNATTEGSRLTFEESPANSSCRMCARLACNLRQRLVEEGVSHMRDIRAMLRGGW